MSTRSALIDAMARAMREQQDADAVWDSLPRHVQDDWRRMARAALAAAEAAGWRLLPPPTDEMPEPQPGQVWVAPSPRIEPRTVRAVGPHRSYPWAGDRCVFWESRGRDGWAHIGALLEAEYEQIAAERDRRWDAGLGRVAADA